MRGGPFDMPGRAISRREFIGTSLMAAVTAAEAHGLYYPHREWVRGASQVSPDPEIRACALWNEGWSFKRQVSPGVRRNPNSWEHNTPGMTILPGSKSRCRTLGTR